MAGFRCYIPNPPATDQQGIVLDAEESRHLVKVRRAECGATVSIFDGRGKEWLCRLITLRGKQAELEILSSHTVAPAKPAITLGIALLKGKTLDTVIQKATELGVARIALLETGHAEVKLNSDRAENRIAKYRQIAIESCKQCGNSHVPEILAPQKLDRFLSEATSQKTLRLIAALTPETLSLRKAIIANGGEPEAVHLLVGPEGDFSESEYEAAFGKGYQAVTLGPNVLRADTAAIVFAALVADALR